MTFHYFYLYKSYIKATYQTYINRQTIFKVCISLPSTKWSGGHGVDIRSTPNTVAVGQNTGHATHWNVLSISKGSVGTYESNYKYLPV